ncbi:GGDEF domain-containing protein [Aquabacterium sp.]|uniref:GGDEF domain-containing protein n=1 Tax=Aquabacterium sp. TaxID=1872578 RepID=UPI002E323BC3|nr:diguanylate cyclase [Aquabacterium sp.]HEX5311157.1 diguanylate cyclase [Aquabacterium sp.]
MPIQNILPLSDWVLSRDPKQRLRIMRSLMAAYSYVACVVLLVYSSWAGFVAPRSMWWLCTAAVVNLAFWYTVLRTGLNRRFQDPSLTLPQVLTGLAIGITAYAVTGPVHGSTLILLALVMIFGIFALQSRTAKIVGAFTVLVMAGTIVYKSATDPIHYPLTLEIAHFILIASILPTISTLAAQFSALRLRLEQQKKDLAEAVDRIQELATRDELTGLINRRHMMEVLNQHQKRLLRSGHHQFYLALLDVDHFKRINDTHGHNVGDEVLNRFASVVESALRDTDILARWGGEEFLLLLNDTTAEVANIALERARTALKDTPLLPSQPDLRITFSAGMTGYLEGELLHACIERADKALYRAKEQGRNCTVIDDRDSVEQEPPDQP